MPSYSIDPAVAVVRFVPDWKANGAAVVVPACSVRTFDPSRIVVLLDGAVINTLDVPERVMALPAFDEDRMVVLASVVPEDVYVPIPTSQLFPLTIV